MNYIVLTFQPFATIHGKYFDKPSLGVNANFVNDKEQIEFLKRDGIF